jgi:hypothetical protein
MVPQHSWSWGHGPWFCSASKACQEALSLFLERGALPVSSFSIPVSFWDVCLSVHGHILILACLSQLNSEAGSTIPSEFRGAPSSALMKCIQFLSSFSSLKIEMGQST